MINLVRPDAGTVHQRRWWALAMLCLSLIIVFAGNATLNVAIPTLSRDLDATTSQLQWVVSIYSLVFAGALFTTGAIGDRFGRKGALQFGLTLYLFGSVLATLSTSMGELIACRAVMGLAGAFIMPSTLSILINVFPPEERTKAIAIWAACIGAAPPLGPVISGVLLGHFWYGSVFLVNVPIIVVALIGGVFLVPTSRDPQEAAFDPAGAITSILGIGALVYALIEAPDRGWVDSITLASFAIGVLGLVAFVLWELRAREPMLDIRYFKNRAFSTGTAGMILVFLGMYGVMFLVVQYLQLVIGYSALSTSVRLLPMTPIMMVVSPLTPRLATRFGANRTVAAGMALVAIGFLLFTQLGVHSSYGFVIFSFMIFVMGMALTMSPMTSAIMSAVPARRAGAGSAMNDATRELGAALGVAVLGSIAASRYANSLHGVVSTLPAADHHVATSSLAGALQLASKLPGATGTALADGAQRAFVDGIHLASIVGVALAVVAALVVWRNLPVDPAHTDAVVEDDEPVVEELALDATSIPA